MEATASPDAELARLSDDERRDANWKRWGPYLAERQWATVREDYSPDGDAWGYFPHEHSRARAYRWGEDGLLGVCDRQGRLCLAVALWNGRDALLKERLFGLTGPEGNHGEDVKEVYFYEDSTPTHSYMRARYRYPQGAFPYEQLIAECARRTRSEAEFELEDTGAFDGGRFFDVTAEYAKASPDDLLVSLTIKNHGPERAELHVLPTLWFRNTWAWGRKGEGYCDAPPTLVETAPGVVRAEHPTLGRYAFHAAPAPGESAPPPLLFCDNETNAERLFGAKGRSAFPKDAVHDAVVHGRAGATNPAQRGTKCAAHYRVTVPAGGEVVLTLRLSREDQAPAAPFGRAFARTLGDRRAEADAFYAAMIPPALGLEERRVARQAYAGLLWSKQFYHYVVREWLEGDPGAPAPSPARARARNADWKHLHCRDVLSMPDAWEYPWFAAWDLAFHAVAFARIDPAFAKQQLLLMLREWYMHPNGQLPAYEWAFGDVNPPVHAWAAWRVYKISGKPGERDRVFLARVFQKLLINFTWWVNRKDPTGNNLFGGGFLGLDNVGVFDRSKPLPMGGRLAQADGTAWMAFYCATMLEIALELAKGDPSYEDLASKFFEHFVAITDAINTLGGSGLWHDEDGFYYDQLVLGGEGDDGAFALRLRSMVGVIPLFACATIEQDALDALPGFAKRTRWFLENRPELSRHIAYLDRGDDHAGGRRLLAIPTRDRLTRVLRYVLDEREFLGPYGVRSLSRVHAEQPYELRTDGEAFHVGYVPGESDSGLFGGNSNWRGPVWVPMNYLLVEALERYHRFYGPTLKVECPVGSGRMLTLHEVAREIARRCTRLFVPGADGVRPCLRGSRFANEPAWREQVPFHEYFHGDSGAGCGASHQTGWTALVARFLEDLADEPA